MEVSVRVTTAVASFVTLLALTATSCAYKELDVTFKQNTCGGGQFQLASNYEEARHLTLRDLSRKTAGNGYDYMNHKVFYSADAYGHSICNGEISHEDCVICLDVCSKYVVRSCTQDYQGFVELEHCQIEYQRIPFPGQRY